MPKLEGAAMIGMEINIWRAAWIDFEQYEAGVSLQKELSDILLLKYALPL